MIDLDTDRPLRIVAAVDGSSTARDVLGLAVGLAIAVPDAEVHLAHVFEADTAADEVDARRAHLDGLVAEATNKLGPRVEAHLLGGVAWRTVVDLAERLEAEIVVIGSRANGAVRTLLLGSVGEQIVRHATCPVLFARKAEEAAAA